MILPKAGRSSFSRRIISIWLVGIVALLPVDLIRLPFNVTLVDCWILMGLPVFWLSFRGKQRVNLTYAAPMWVILVGSIASTFVAPEPSNSLIVILKEIFLFSWFVTLTALLGNLNAEGLRRILIVWIAVVFLHGFVIVAQFFSPSFWRLVTSLAGSTKDFEIYRPSGLFTNANSAAFFQLLGFVPIVLASPSEKVAMVLGMLLLPTMLATGSMGAATAFLVGTTVAMVAVSLSGHLALVLKTFTRLAIIVGLLGGVFYFVISQNERFQEHLAGILLGRSERSSEGRFDLWQRGVDVYVDHNAFLLGVGPENFRIVDGNDKQLHNDFLAFSVERGVLGTLGLLLFAAIAVTRAVQIMLRQNRSLDGAGLRVAVFLAAAVAILVESQTHQIFHYGELWLVLALQEAMLSKIQSSDVKIKPEIRTLDTSVLYHRDVVV